MSVSVQSANTLTTPTPTSSIRRKPKFTYQSPLPTEVRDPTTLTSYSKKPSSQQTDVFNQPPPPPPTTATSTPRNSSSSLYSPVRNPARYSHKPSLPLYHPLGRLALSLPPLDPAKYGLPIPNRPDIELLAQQAHLASPPLNNDNKSWRSTPTGSRRDSSLAADEGGQTSTATPSETKASPRKRRNGAGTGGGGGSSRRKRKEVDEDATYAAANKRPRYPRGSAASALANADEDAGNDTPDLPGVVVDEDKQVAERRTTRSRTTMRRDSTASTTSASIPATRAASAVGKEDGEVVGAETAIRRSRSKEEGEVSEQ